MFTSRGAQNEVPDVQKGTVVTKGASMGRFVKTVVLIAALGGVTALSSGVAVASTAKNGYHESGEFGLYYNSNRVGCVFDLYLADSNFSGEYFKDHEMNFQCGGLGQKVNDNTASYWNKDTWTWEVATDANYDGSVGWIDQGVWSNASASFKNAVSSARPI
ncbi:peptidase inhibitor family I36 protein [Streptomyces sp. 061-3]|uniref:peptidase inhibitor family I36 protein n=1 Tax=Streptomyces sp. 061-3 TaxID=2789268 RepID=UPI00397F3C97